MRFVLNVHDHGPARDASRLHAEGIARDTRFVDRFDDGLTSAGQIGRIDDNLRPAQDFDARVSGLAADKRPLGLIGFEQARTVQMRADRHVFTRQRTGCNVDHRSVAIAHRTDRGGQHEPAERTGTDIHVDAGTRCMVFAGDDFNPIVGLYRRAGEIDKRAARFFIQRGALGRRLQQTLPIGVAQRVAQHRRHVVHEVTGIVFSRVIGQILLHQRFGVVQLGHVVGESVVVIADVGDDHVGLKRSERTRARHSDRTNKSVLIGGDRHVARIDFVVVKSDGGIAVHVVDDDVCAARSVSRDIGFHHVEVDLVDIASRDVDVATRGHDSVADLRRRRPFDRIDENQTARRTVPSTRAFDADIVGVIATFASHGNVFGRRDLRIGDGRFNVVSKIIDENACT